MKISFALFAILLSLCGCDYFKQKSPPLNFLFFLVNDLGWTDLGCYESSFYDTPEIDQFAKTAMRFTEAYAAMVEAMDEAVGKVLNVLDSLGLSRHTIVFFMSDNGGLSTSEGHPTTNLPLKAGKGWLYEGGIREPMIIRWPGVVDPNSTCSWPVISTDFYPTILDIAGIPLIPDQHRDGISLTPLLKGHEKVGRNKIFWHYPHYGNQGGSPGSAIRYNNYKLIEFFEDGHLELYDIENDIGEKHNLISTHAEIADSLYNELKSWRQEVDARYPTPNPDD
jgi:arylsulfatase A-like enzyme